MGGNRFGSATLTQIKIHVSRITYNLKPLFMKKKLLLVGLTALALASCSNEEKLTDSGNADKAIAFGTFVEKATKGTPISGTTFPVDGDFLVIGYSTGTADLTASEAPNFMRQTVTKTDASTYSYAPVRYWPSLTGAKISFFAVSPASLASSVTPTAVSATAGALPVLSYTVPTDALKQKDLLLAGAVNKTYAGGTVAFSFTHALTKIGFKAKLAADYSTSGAYVRIESISLKNVASDGVFSFGATGSYTLTASSTSDYTLGYLANLVDNGSVSTTTLKNMLLDNSYLMLIPSDYSSSATAALEVVYKITYSDGSTTTNTTTKLLKDLTSGNNWTAASSISYNMTITLNAVSFSASTSDWATDTDTSL
jgi:hypothetical protein